MTTPYGREPEPMQPQYGQPPAQFEPPPSQPYGPPGARYGPVANAYGEPVGSGAKFGVVGATLAGVGAVLAIVAFTAVAWLDNNVTFGDLHDAASRGGAPGLSKNYFGWLAWLLLIVTVVVAIAANLPSPASGPLRALGAVLAVVGIVLTIFALKGDGAFGDTFSNASAGFYLAIAGFLLIGIGALVGPRSRF